MHAQFIKHVLTLKHFQFFMLFMSPSQKTVAIYARVSTDKQAVDMQLSELRDFVKRSNWKIYKEYIDKV